MNVIRALLGLPPRARKCVMCSDHPAAPRSPICESDQCAAELRDCMSY